MNRGYHNDDECPHDTSQNCTLLQSYYEIFLKDFIYYYEADEDVEPNKLNMMELIIARIERCLRARINAAQNFGDRSDQNHFKYIMDTLLFHDLLVDIFNQGNININKYLNKQVNHYGINTIHINRTTLANINFMTTERHEYTDFLTRILEYNIDRRTLPCMHNNIINSYYQPHFMDEETIMRTILRID